MKKRTLIKYLALVLVMTAALLLSGCRTRITNNSEVSNVYYDENGLISETYQERRDELGLSIAEKPLMPDLGGAEEEEDYEYDGGESLNYEEEEPYVEPIENKEDDKKKEEQANKNNNNKKNNNNNNSTPTTEIKVTVTFDGNGGTPSKKSITLTKGSKIGKLPSAKHSGGKKFQGWFTTKIGGNKVDSKMTVSLNTTLYAHWKDPDPKSISITLKYNDNVTGDESISVIENGKYEGLPENLTTRGIGYEFNGWYDESGNPVKNGDSIGKNPPKILNAMWYYYPDKFWENEFNVAANSILPEGKKECVIDEPGPLAEVGKNLIETCKGNVSGDSGDKDTATVVVKFVSSQEVETDEKASTLVDTIKNGGEYSKAEMVLLINADAVTTKIKNQEILYKMLILQALYEGIWFDVDKAKGIDELNTDGVVLVR